MEWFVIIPLAAFVLYPAIESVVIDATADRVVMLAFVLIIREASRHRPSKK